MGVGESIIARDGDMPMVARGMGAGPGCGVCEDEWCRFGDGTTGDTCTCKRSSEGGITSSGYLRFLWVCGGVASGERNGSGMV